MAAMASLTCRNHPDLRWSCKDIATSGDGTPGTPARYNGARNIFFFGRPVQTPEGHTSYEHAPECPCPASELVFAPEHQKGE